MSRNRISKDAFSQVVTISLLTVSRSGDRISAIVSITRV
jgi:hypothetical protein